MEIGSLLAVVHVLHADQVHVMFRARLDQPVFGAGDESLEVMLCDEAEIPWADIAFRSVEFALRRYLEDRSAGLERHHFTAIDLRPPARPLRRSCCSAAELWQNSGLHARRRAARFH